MSGQGLHCRMITAYGEGPEGATCGDCANLVAHRRTKTYFKCRMTVMTSGGGTDWRLKWRACGKYSERAA